MPAMIFISVDLPAPFTPSTPIFTPGRKDKRDALEHLAAARKGLGQILHHIDVLVAGHGPIPSNAREVQAGG